MLIFKDKIKQREVRKSDFINIKYLFSSSQFQEKGKKSVSNFSTAEW